MVLHARAEEEAAIDAEGAARVLGGDASPLERLADALGRDSALLAELRARLAQTGEPLVEIGAFTNERTVVGPLAPPSLPDVALALELDRTALPDGTESFEVEQAADPFAAILDPEAGKAKAVGARRVERTVDRTDLVLAQTPQVFTRELITRAYAQPNLDSTDDASLVEQLGEEVVLVPGDLRGMKITTHEDFTVLRAMLNLKGPKERSDRHKF